MRGKAIAARKMVLIVWFYIIVHDVGSQPFKATHGGGGPTPSGSATTTRLWDMSQL